MRRTRLWLVAIVVAAAVIVGAGCGSSSSTTSGGESTSAGTAVSNPTATPGINVPVDQKIVAELPSSVKSSGTLTVAADATYAPDEFIAKDGHTVIGMDADLAKALAQSMGLTADVKNVNFGAIIPGLAANRYDLGMSSFTVTKEREKAVDFVSYAQAGTSMYVKSDGGPDIGSLADLCGHSVGVEQATIQEQAAKEQDGKCKADGKPGVTVSVFPDQNAANLSVSSGRAEVGMADSPVASYIVAQSNGQFKLTGKPFGTAAYGIALPKNSGLSKPVLDAVKNLMADGTYDKVLSYWGLTASSSATNGCPCSITNPQINPTNVPAS